MNLDKIDPLAEKSVDRQIDEMVEEEFEKEKREAFGDLHHLL